LAAEADKSITPGPGVQCLLYPRNTLSWSYLSLLIAYSMCVSKLIYNTST